MISNSHPTLVCEKSTQFKVQFVTSAIKSDFIVLSSTTRAVNIQSFDISFWTRKDCSNIVLHIHGIFTIGPNFYRSAPLNDGSVSEIGGEEQAEDSFLSPDWTIELHVKGRFLIQEVRYGDLMPNAFGIDGKGRKLAWASIIQGLWTFD